jgi:hypothetical protein
VIFEERPARGILEATGCFRFIAGSNYCGFTMYFFTEHDLAHIALLRRRWWFYYVTELTRLAAATSLEPAQMGTAN